MLNYQRCPVCGEPVSPTWKGDGNRLICPFCNTICSQQTDDDKITEHELKAIYALLDQLEFEEASKRLGSMREQYPNNSRLYFLTCLAENHVCYTQDAVDHKKYIPTLNDLPESDIREHSYAKKAISLAESDEVRQTYQDCFDYLDQKRLEIIQQRKELHYDIFISVKVSEVDEEGRVIYDSHNKRVHTKDYDLAYQTYLFLREQFPDLKVFFSESTDAKELMAGNRYENVIYAALQSAKAFILVADSRTNIEWRWVRNEWKRYLLASEKDPIGHHLVLLTNGLNPNDLPPELKGREFIDASSIFRANEVLKTFVSKNCYGAARIKAKTFETTDIAKKVVRGPEMEIVSKTLKHYKGSGSASLNATLDRLTVDLDPAHPIIREEAFEELEAIAREHPDVLRAQALLLLKGTDIPNFEALVSDLKLLLANLDTFKSYLDLTDEKSGRAVLEKLMTSLGSAKTLSEFDGKTIDGILRECVLPYREFIHAESIQRFVERAETNFDLIVRSDAGFDLLRTLLNLHRYLDKDDPALYLERRSAYVAKITKMRRPGKEALRFASSLISESLEVDPTHVMSAFRGLQILAGLPLESYEKAQADFDYLVSLCSHCVGDEERLKFIRVLLQNGDEKARQTFLAAFLLSVIRDSKTFEDFGKESGEDAELSGYGLFMRYIGYPLPDKWPAAFAKRSIDAQTTLNPDPSVFAYAKNPKSLDVLLARFGVKCHLHGQYGRAKEIYAYYLGEQEDPASEDCLLVRFYSTLAMSRVASINDLPQSHELLDYKQLGSDMIIAGKSNPNVQRLYESINEAYSKQKETVRLFDLCAQEIEDLRFYLNADTTRRAKEQYLAIKQTLATFNAPSLAQETEKMGLRIKELEAFTKDLETAIAEPLDTENTKILNEKLDHLKKLRAELERTPYQSEKEKQDAVKRCDDAIATMQKSVIAIEKRNARYESVAVLSKILGVLAILGISLANLFMILLPLIGVFPWNVQDVCIFASMGLPIFSILCLALHRSRLVFRKHGTIVPDIQAIVIIYAALVLFIYDMNAINMAITPWFWRPLAVMGCFLTVAILAAGHIISVFNPKKRRFIGRISGYIALASHGIGLTLPVFWLLPYAYSYMNIDLNVDGFFNGFAQVSSEFWFYEVLTFLGLIALAVLCILSKKNKKTVLFGIITGIMVTVIALTYLIYIPFFVGSFFAGLVALQGGFTAQHVWVGMILSLIGTIVCFVPSAIALATWIGFVVKKKK